MGNTNLKRRLKSLIFPVAIIGVWAGIFLDFHHSNNYVVQIKDKEFYYFQVGKTKDPFTRRIFTKCNFENSPREAYFEDSLLIGTKLYVDEPLDNLVDEITLYKPFANKPSLDLIRTRDYDNFKPEFDKADKNFIKNKNDFVKEMRK